MTADEGAIGRAGVYGGSINPLQLYIQQGLGRKREQAQAQQQLVKQRDDLIADLRKFNPDKVWEPFYDEVNRYVQENVRNRTYQGLEAGVPISRLNQELDKTKGDANTLVNKINWMKTEYEGMNKRIDEDEYLNQDYYRSQLNQRYFNGMNAKPVAEIDTKGMENMFKDSKGYKVDKIVTDFVKDLPTNITEYNKEYFDQLGQMFDIQTLETKLGLERDAKGNLVVDPRTLQPKVKMTDDVYIQALLNERLVNIMNDNLPPTASHEEKKAFLTELMAGKDPRTIRNTPRVGHKFGTGDSRFSLGGYGFTQSRDTLEGRDEVLERVVKGHEDALAYFGEINKDLKAEFSPDKKKIIISFPSYEIDILSDEEEAKLSPTERSQYRLNRKKSKVVSTKEYDISTPEKARAAKIQLSQRMDDIDPKRAIGQEYIQYVDAKRKESAKKKGGSGVNWKK